MVNLKIIFRSRRYSDLKQSGDTREGETGGRGRGEREGEGGRESNNFKYLGYTLQKTQGQMQGAYKAYLRLS